jgi:hypothetical protein
MRTLTRTASLLGCLLLPACADPTAPRGPQSPDLVVAGRSGCYVVEFNVAVAIDPAAIFVAHGVVTGDLQGTATFVFDPASLHFAGKTLKNAGTATWDVTGGVTGPLAFTTTFDNLNIITDRPGSPAVITEQVGTHHAVSGVEVANLHYKGSFSDVTVSGSHDYRGVICP